MGLETGTLVLAALAGSTAASLYQGEQQRKAGSRAATQAREAAEASANDATRAQNKANAKMPDVNALLAAAQAAGKGGAGSTMLTGPAGVDPAALTLGKSTLLGG